MKKIILSTVVIIVIAGLGFFLIKKKSSEPLIEDIPSTSLEQSANFDPYTGAPLTSEQQNIRLSIEQKIEKGDIVGKATEVPGEILIDEYPQTEIPSVVPDYSTTYSQEDKSFLITLYGFPLQNTRTRAEKYLLQKLDISSQEACLLSIRVMVNTSISLELAGQNLGLSFCPDSRDLSSYTENIDGVSNIAE